MGGIDGVIGPRTMAAARRLVARVELRAVALVLLLRALDLERLIADAAPDDEDLRSAAVISLVQSELFEALVSLREAEGEDDPAKRLKLLSQAARAIAEASHASIAQRRWQDEVRAKVAAAKAAEEIGRKDGVSEETIRLIRREIMGIAG